MITLLDHGYVSLVESWGSDERIIESARMSTQKSFEGWGPLCVDCVGGGKMMNPQPEDATCSNCGLGGLMYTGDEKLLRYLWVNKHSTPFEMAGAIFEVQAPIFVYREWHRHRTQSYSEASARYAPLPAFDYVPTLERVMAGGGHLTKQAAAHSTQQLQPERAAKWLSDLEDVYRHAENVYRDGLEMGIPKELARLSMSVGRYSKMRASANLRNWFAFLQLRLDTTAQWEIRTYAGAVGTMLKERFPRSYELFEEGMKKPTV